MPHAATALDEAAIREDARLNAAYPGKGLAYLRMDQKAFDRVVARAGPEILSEAGDAFWHKEMPAKFPHLVLREDHLIKRVPFGHSLKYGRARWTWRGGKWYEWTRGGWRAGTPPSRLQLAG